MNIYLAQKEEILEPKQRNLNLMQRMDYIEDYECFRNDRKGTKSR
jgi:hypothetical protein